MRALFEYGLEVLEEQSFRQVVDQSRVDGLVHVHQAAVVVIQGAPEYLVSVHLHPGTGRWG